MKKFEIIYTQTIKYFRVSEIEAENAEQANNFFIKRIHGNYTERPSFDEMEESDLGFEIIKVKEI